jgi:hypothetical protein
MSFLWLQAFILTLLSETATGCILWLKTGIGPSAMSLKAIGCIFIASTITHPILWFIIFPFSLSQDWSYSFFLLIGEGYVWFIEGLWYLVCRFQKPFFFSLVLNGASIILGLVLHRLDLL